MKVHKNPRTHYFTDAQKDKVQALLMTFTHGEPLEGDAVEELYYYLNEVNANN